MPAVLHSGLTGADLHEPKDIASATASQVYIADGSGSGDMTTLYGINTERLTASIPDCSTADYIFIPVPVGSTFTSAQVVLENAISAADASLTFTRNGTSSFGSALTVPYTGSAVGTTLTFTPSTNTAISTNGYIKIATDGASTTACRLFITVTLTRTA